MNLTMNLTTKRLQGELKNLKRYMDPTYQVIQDDKESLRFHFMIRGLKGSDYEGGYYIGRIDLPKNYPASPGSYFMSTPNGRFTTNSEICLTNSRYHSSEWSAIWNLQTMMIGFLSIFSADVDSGISHIKESPMARKRYAKESVKYNLTNHKNIFIKFDKFVNPDGEIKTEEEINEYIKNNSPQQNNSKITETTKTTDKENNGTTKLENNKTEQNNIQSERPETYQDWLKQIYATKLSTYNENLYSMSYRDDKYDENYKSLEKVLKCRKKNEKIISCDIKLINNKLNKNAIQRKQIQRKKEKRSNSGN
jgi:ubiquitin-protein ligase